MNGSAARAFAPVAPIVATGPQKPRPLDDPRPQPTPGPQAAAERGVGADLLAAADNADLDAAARLSLISVSLDRTERRQATAVGEIAADARAGAAKLSAVVARAELAPDSLVAPAAKGGVGGPFIPLSVDPAAPAFDKALANAARDVAEADHLSRLLPILPVRAPLIGETSVSSPFGYRIDPFLGKPMLHSGVDLVQDYGSEIHATAGGRVTHAGPMGGYGDMVEIDHGNGLDDPLRPPVGNPGCGRPGGGGGRADRPSRLDRPFDRPAPALRGSGRRRAGRSRAFPRRRRAAVRDAALAPSR